LWSLSPKLLPVAPPQHAAAPLEPGAVPDLRDWVAAGARTSRGRTHASRQRTSPSDLPRRRLPRQGSGRRATSSLVITVAAKMDLFSAPTYNFTRDSYRMQVSVGSVLYPSNPIRSCAEQYSQLVKAVGSLQEAVGLSIGRELSVERAHRGH
jgi:hypothetical protein